MKNTKFKVGDRVERILTDNNLIKIGNIYEVVDIEISKTYQEGYGLVLQGFQGRYDPDLFIPHKESKVLEILKNYDKIRSIKGQGTTQVDS